MNTTAQFVFFCAICASPAPAQTEHHALVRLPELGQNVEVRFTSNPLNSSVVHFRINGKFFALTAKYGINDLSGDPSTLMLPDKNSGFKFSAAHRLLIGRYGSRDNQHTLLGFPGGGQNPNGADSLMLVGFRADGSPYTVMQRGDFGILSLAVLPSGDAVLYGWQYLSEVTACDGDIRNGKPYATTYDPSAAYILHPDSIAQYSLEESRAYNQQHYVWAGRNASDKVAVIQNVPGHPRFFVVPAAQVEKYVHCKNRTP